jgi:multiple sugar transport system permease protein
VLREQRQDVTTGMVRTGIWRIVGIVPLTLLFAFLTVLPIAEMFYLGFFSVSWQAGQRTLSFVGAQNWLRVGDDHLFLVGWRNTFVFVVVAVAIEMVLGFFLALITTRVVKGQALYRAIFMIPILVPAIVIGAVWKLMFDYDFGIINQLGALVGLSPQNWLGNPNLALASVIAVDVWHWTPFVFLLMLAGLASLPQDVYEAARVDGAGFAAELRFITLPMMRATIIVTLAFRGVIAFKVFDEIFLLTAGGPGTATEVVSYSIFRRFFSENQPGYGSAVAVVSLFILCLILVVGNQGLRRLRARP